MMALLRHAGVLLFRLRLHRVIMWLNRRHPKVLLYHACEVEESDFIRGLHSNTTPADLELHLDFLLRHYTVVAASEIAQGRAPERAAAITFDDGYRSAYVNALPILRARGVPAMMFLVSDVVGNREFVWLNELNWLLRRAPAIAIPIAKRELSLPQSCTIEDILDASVERFDRSVLQRVIRLLRDQISAENTSLASYSRLYVDWNEVSEMADGGFSFGAHTATHPNLERLGADAQRLELREARETIADRLGTCDSFAYPFGRIGHDSRLVALETGHSYIFEVGGINAPADATRIARVPVFARTEAELFAELEVVAPVKAVLKGLRDRMRPRGKRSSPQQAYS